MAVHKVKKGLDLPIGGAPEQRIEHAAAPPRVALLAADYIGMKPTMHVQVGDEVRRGQTLFEDKRTPGVHFTAPAAGRIEAIHRGQRRALVSVVIETSDEERSTGAETVAFAAYTGKPPAELTAEQVRDLLVESGLWTALRTRPYSNVPSLADSPHSIFITATDSQPHAPDLGLVLAAKGEDFERGLVALSQLTAGQIHVCITPGLRLRLPTSERLRVHQFTGKHPSGTVGYHIHTIDPVDRAKQVWHIGCQDVVAVGRLFASGELDPARVISLAGPGVERPRLLATRIGAAVDTLVEGELKAGEMRVLSGSVLAGRIASGGESGFLGRYHQQVSVLAEGREREFLGMVKPGANKFSTINAFVSRLMPGRTMPFTTTTHGSSRAIVPIGMYERVFPLDIPATFLLRSLAVGDIERAERLGCLELDEEDLALCTFVCSGKNEYGPFLRDVLNTIEKEG